MPLFIQNIASTGQPNTTINGGYTAAISAGATAADDVELRVHDRLAVAEQSLAGSLQALTILLRAAAGVGVQDWADRLTTPIRYSALTPIATARGDWGAHVFSTTRSVTIRGMIFASPQSLHGNILRIATDPGTVLIENCILWSEGDGSVFSNGFLNSANVTLRNSLIVTIGNRSGDTVRCEGGTMTLENVTIIHAGAAGTRIGLRRNAGALNCFNVAIAGYGATTFQGTIGGDRIATDQASAPGTNPVLNVPFAQFATDASGTATTDLRLPAGSSLLGAGAARAGVTIDMHGRTRPSTPSIGALDVAASSSITGDANITLANDTVSATGGGNPGDGAASITLAGDTVSASGNVSITGAASITLDAAVLAATGTGGTPSVTFGPCRDKFRNLRANETGVIVDVYNASTGAQIVRITGQSTNASAMLTVGHASLANGTLYRWNIQFSDGEQCLPGGTTS